MHAPKHWLAISALVLAVFACQSAGVSTEPVSDRLAIWMNPPVASESHVQSLPAFQSCRM